VNAQKSSKIRKKTSQQKYAKRSAKRLLYPQKRQDFDPLYSPKKNKSPFFYYSLLSFDRTVLVLVSLEQEKFDLFLKNSKFIRSSPPLGLHQEPKIR